MQLDPSLKAHFCDENKHFGVYLPSDAPSEIIDRFQLTSKKVWMKLW